MTSSPNLVEPVLVQKEIKIRKALRQPKSKYLNYKMPDYTKSTVELPKSASGYSQDNDDALLSKYLFDMKTNSPRRKASERKRPKPFVQT